jgi:probable DNA repair protein
VRSPFLGGAEQEMLARAQLDARLRRVRGSRVSLGKVLALTGPCPLLRALLEDLFAKAQKKESQSPHAWAQQFTVLLQAAGFPGERTLDSEEFQARARFEEQLGEFARLGAVPGKISCHEALRQLRRICADALFQPGPPGSSAVPVQVVGVLESAGMEFDCLWVGGLTEENWPLKARPHPFLPVALQRKAGIPEAAPETSLALDRRITQGWLAAADEVVLSWPEKDGDRDLLPSPLIADVAPGSVEVAGVSSYQDVLFQARNLESFSDDNAPALREQEVRGGTRVLADQAACPFRAFAHHRLRAEALDAPSAGPDAMDRGILLHTLMAQIWKEVKTSAGLELDLSDVITRSALESVRQLGLEGRFAELEKKRLEKLAREWLEVEKERPAFEVVAIEEKRGLEIGGLAFSGRIDRMDRLADGTYALIDYKTGAQLTPRMWMDERPDEPQLPLYAVSAGEKVKAVAFARLKTGAMRYMGYAAAKEALPGLTHYPTWDELLQGWKTELEELAAGYAQGAAQVDPKRGLATCRYCDLKPLCRVHERLSALAEDGEERE